MFPSLIATKCRPGLIEDDCKRKPCQVRQSRMCCFVLLEMLPLQPDPTSLSRACGRKFSHFLLFGALYSAVRVAVTCGSWPAWSPSQGSREAVIFSSNLLTTFRAPHTAVIQRQSHGRPGEGNGG